MYGIVRTFINLPLTFHNAPFPELNPNRVEIAVVLIEPLFYTVDDCPFIGEPLSPSKWLSNRFEGSGSPTRMFSCMISRSDLG